MRYYATLILGSAACLLNVSRSQAQGRPPEFEVASIKPGNPDSRLLRTVITPGGNLRAENVTLRTLIEDAYGMKPFQLSGDRTGLSGTFDFEFDATRDESEPNPFVAPWAPSLGQIGLKLESAKGPVEFFTVERAEKPSEN
jgi:hypothetical protein